jgi:hypothetical protein
MPTAKGSIKRDDVDATKFTSTFLVDGIEFHFNGAFDFPVPEFDYNSATLTYEDGAGFGGPGEFIGMFGPENIELNLQNGERITGNEEIPTVLGDQILGRGIWTQF